MTKRGELRALAIGALATTIALAASARAAVSHRSETALPSSNGRGAIAFNATTWRVTQFLEHAYLSPHAGQQSRNFAFDSYPGVRIGGAGTWLSAVQPTRLEYLPGTGIIHAQRTIQGITLDEYELAPMGLAENASVMILKCTAAASSPSPAIDAYSIFNYHLGSGSPLPGTDAESITYDAGRDAWFESGPSGVAFAYLSIGASTHHGSSPSNPYNSLQSAQNLADNAGTGGAAADAVAGFQTSLGALAAGATTTTGWITVLAPDANAQGATDRVRAWVNGRAPEKLLADEIAAWAAWQKPAPPGATALESSLAAQSQAILRMGQVTENGASGGQILASIAPGQWNISWVRDMAYATVALVKSGHLAEAKAALAFQMGASAGQYQQYVGKPYQISVVRYFGDGTEESDSNADGPNVEFDGFGLFLWSLDEYLRASKDTASLAAWWPAVKAKVADVLVSLQDGSTGVMSADSSIWEVHWNGKQKHFAYTTITAANGLCAASRMATLAGDGASAATYQTRGALSRDAVLGSLRAADETIAQSTEGLAAGSGWLDAAAIEAINFGLVDPSRRTARATLRSIGAGLVPPSGRGFMRNQSGGWYDSQEWVFVDLRAERAIELRGDTSSASALLAWNVDQASDNFGELSELHDATTADYAGASPMVGFGAGAYLIALEDRGSPVTPTCGAFASEPADPVDGGVAGDDGGVGGDGSTAGADASPPPPGSQGDGGPGSGPGGSSGGGSSGCSCDAVGGSSSRGGALALLVALAAVGARRRRGA